MLTLMSEVSGVQKTDFKKLNKYSNDVIWSSFELMLIMIMSVNFVESSCWAR